MRKLLLCLLAAAGPGVCNGELIAVSVGEVECGLLGGTQGRKVDVYAEPTTLSGISRFIHVRFGTTTMLLEDGTQLDALRVALSKFAKWHATVSRSGGYVDKNLAVLTVRRMAWWDGEWEGANNQAVLLSFFSSRTKNLRGSEELTYSLLFTFPETTSDQARTRTRTVTEEGLFSDTQRKVEVSYHKTMESQSRSLNLENVSLLAGVLSEKSITDAVLLHEQLK